MEVKRLDAQLAGHLRSDRRFPAATIEQNSRLIRVAVNQAAVRRLTDISVTPRQLRRHLGIANDEEAGYS